MRLKAARFYVTALYVVCPNCDRNMPNPQHGNVIWTGADLDDYRDRDLLCGCGQTMRIGKGVYK